VELHGRGGRPLRGRHRRLGAASLIAKLA
jgi:hypothetical protein